MQMGVESLVSFHLHMRLNGKYYGMWEYVEQMDADSLAVSPACMLPADVL